MLLVLALAAHASASYQCGFQSGFERPELQKQAVQKCTQPKQELFIEIQDWEFRKNHADYLDASESCELFTLDGNPNCVKSDGGSSLHNLKPQCQIDFGGKTVKIGSVIDKGNTYNYDLFYPFSSKGCRKEGSDYLFLSESLIDFQNEVLSDNFIFLDGYSAWSICFTPTTHAVSKCNGND